MQSCPCGSGEAFTACCGPLLDGHQSAQHPEQLMRSRFSAFALGYWQYIIDTWHPDYRPTLSTEMLAEEAKASQWERLEVFSSAIHVEGVAGNVDFCAWYRDADGLHPHREHSDFVLENGRWYYTRGRHGHPAPEIAHASVSAKHKVRVNDPCPCDSGKKYKKCCARQH